MSFHHVRTGLFGLALASGVLPRPPAAQLAQTPVAGQGEHATAIAADPAVVWGALHRVLAARSIAVRRADSTARRLVAGPLRLDPEQGPSWGECAGLVSTWEPKPVRGNAIAKVAPAAGGATIRITLVWAATGPDVSRECRVRGDWERALEREVKQEAERAGEGR